ncbi:MAG: DUF1376 domain-containing protein [Sphingobium limneticum]
MWTDAYLADTRHLSTLEHGAYFLLMMEAWRRPSCSLPDDDVMLARLAGLDPDGWATVKPIILAMWKLDRRSKTWTQKRLTKEKGYVRKKSKSQKDKAVKRWNKTEKSDATALPQQCPDDAPTPTPTLVIKEEPKGSSKKTRRLGSRLPDNWTLPADWRDWAANDWGWPPDVIQAEADQFRDYWCAKPGREGTKTDWLATWRNWCRNSRRNPPKGNYDDAHRSQLGAQGGSHVPNSPIDALGAALNLAGFER